MNDHDEVNGTTDSMLRTAMCPFGSNSVISISFSVVPPPNRRIVARRREPTAAGPGVVACSSIALADQRGVISGVDSTRNTSMSGRSMVTVSWTLATPG